jgi:hypothetical protein
MVEFYGVETPFPHEHLPPIPPAPANRISNYRSRTGAYNIPRDADHVTMVIRRVLELMRQKEMMHVDACAVVAEEATLSPKGIERIFHHYATEEEKDAANVMKAIRQRRWERMERAMPKVAELGGTFTDLCDHVAALEGTEVTGDHIREQFIFNRHLTTTAQMALVQRYFPHVGHGTGRVRTKVATRQPARRATTREQAVG